MIDRAPTNLAARDGCQPAAAPICVLGSHKGIHTFWQIVFSERLNIFNFAAGLPCSIKPPPAESGPGAPPRSGPLGVQPDEKCCPCRLILSEVQPSAFTDFQNKRPHSRDALRPSFADRSPSTNAEGAGKAGWPHAPGAPAQKIFARAREPQVQAVTTGLPCAVVYGLYALSPVNHPVCHRRLALILRKA